MSAVSSRLKKSKVPQCNTCAHFSAILFPNKVKCLGIFNNNAKGSQKKQLFLLARPLRGGGKSLATKKRKTFSEAIKKIPHKNVATKLEGGGTKKELLCGFPKIQSNSNINERKIEIPCYPYTSSFSDYLTLKSSDRFGDNFHPFDNEIRKS